MIAAPAKLLLLAVVIFAAITDIRSRRIPNYLTLAGVLLGLGVNAWLGSWSGLVYGLKGMGLALLIYFPLFALRGMGAGDVKLMAAVGAVSGAGNWFSIFLLTAVIGGVIGIFVSLASGRLKKTLWNVGYLVRELINFRAPYLSKEELDVKSSKALRLPHGMVIALGVIAFLSFGPIIRLP